MQDTNRPNETEYQNRPQSNSKTRRAYLAVLAVGTSGLAGCLNSSESDPTASGSPTAESAGTPAPEGTAEAPTTSTTEPTNSPEPQASITILDQETDGKQITLDEVSVNVGATVTVLDREGRPLGDIQPESAFEGTTGQDITVPFDQRLVQSTTVEVEITDAQNERLAADSAQITIPGLDEKHDVTLIEADPGAGFNYPYFFAAPPAQTATGRPLLVETNNTGTSTDDFAQHQSAAREAIENQFVNALSTRLELPRLVPVFPRPESDPVDWRHDAHQLDTDTMHIEDGPLARVDRQLLRMVEDAKKRLQERSYPVNDRLFMNGFSASGLFASRFSALQPSAVDAVGAGGINGHPILPIEEAKGHTLNYQIGIADIDEITGEAFDKAAFTDTPQFLYMGAEDENDTFGYSDSWGEDQQEVARDVYGEEMVADRFRYSESVYEEQGVNAEFRVFSGAGHEITQDMFRSVTEFFHDQLHESELKNRLSK